MDPLAELTNERMISDTVNELSTVHAHLVSWANIFSFVSDFLTDYNSTKVVSGRVEQLLNAVPHSFVSSMGLIGP